MAPQMYLNLVVLLYVVTALTLENSHSLIMEEMMMMMCAFFIQTTGTSQNRNQVGN